MEQGAVFRPLPALGEGGRVTGHQRDGVEGLVSVGEGRSISTRGVGEAGQGHLVVDEEGVLSGCDVIVGGVWLNDT